VLLSVAQATIKNMPVAGVPSANDSQTSWLVTFNRAIIHHGM